MAKQIEVSPVARTPLNRARVLAAAVSLADEAGIESLSMRRIAHGLGVVPMALYKHVANKDDMLDGMIDIVFSEIDLPSGGTEWKTALRQRAISARAVLRSHPWAVGLMESRVRPGPANLRHHDAVLGHLRSAGFSVEMAIHAYSALDSYIYGFTLQEQTLPFESPGDVSEMAEAMLQDFPADEYPYLTETLVEHFSKKVYAYADEFEFGLDLILDGLERL